MTQSSSECSLAPTIRPTVGISSTRMPPRISPTTIMKTTAQLKISRAFCTSPLPRYLAATALDPVPNLSPSANITTHSGMTRLTAAKADTPSRLDTKYPSTI